MIVMVSSKYFEHQKTSSKMNPVWGEKSLLMLSSKHRTYNTQWDAKHSRLEPPHSPSFSQKNKSIFFFSCAWTLRPHLNIFLSLDFLRKVTLKILYIRHKKFLPMCICPVSLTLRPPRWKLLAEDCIPKNLKSKIRIPPIVGSGRGTSQGGRSREAGRRSRGGGQGGGGGRRLDRQPGGRRRGRGE